MHRFKVGDLLRNRKTKENGRVIELRNDGSYVVTVLQNPMSWTLGAVEAYWADYAVEVPPVERVHSSQLCG
jgi:hypothetical protein